MEQSGDRKHIVTRCPRNQDPKGRRGGPVGWESCGGVEETAGQAKLIEDKDRTVHSKSCPNVTLSWRQVHLPLKVIVTVSIVGRAYLLESVMKKP